MKRMSVMCMMVLCLAVGNLSSSPMSRIPVWETLEQTDKKEFDRRRDEYNDPVKLKEKFEKGFLLPPSTSDEEKEAFKRIFGVSDKIMLPILMDIIRESAAKTEWKRSEWGTSNDIDKARYQLQEAIRWLDICADTNTKRFLLEIATDTSKDSYFRRAAVDSYLSCANAHETRDAVASFLSDDMRQTFGIDVISVYYAVMRAYDRAGGDTQTRGAIVAAVSAAVVKEENKDAFSIADERLAERSRAYADSPQRKAARERLNIPAEKGEQ